MKRLRPASHSGKSGKSGANNFWHLIWKVPKPMAADWAQKFLGGNIMIWGFIDKAAPKEVVIHALKWRASGNRVAEFEYKSGRVHYSEHKKIH